MTISVHFAAPATLWPEYREPLRRAGADLGLDLALSDQAPDPASVDYVVFAPGGAPVPFAAFSCAKAVLSLWAGVERIAPDASLTQPLCRMVDPSMTRTMTEYVCGHVLRHHLGMDAHILGQDGVWRNGIVPPLAAERPVTVLGLGALGGAAARALAGLGFPVTGWSRSPRQVPGIDCLSGAVGLTEALRRAAILVTLLPHTAETDGLLDARRLALLPRGAMIVNPGRGSLIDEEALLAALDSGALGHATLDVFRTEPLPEDHPFWRHKGVTVTPHVAAETRPDTAARVIAENIRRGEAGEPFLHLVERGRGY